MKRPAGSGRGRHAPGAQVVASIPNARNAILIAALAVNGRWQYRERGLLDINVYRSNQGRGKVSIQLGRLTLADITPEELQELCAEQFVVRARPA